MDELIKEYHKLYAEFKRDEYLQIAADLGKVRGPTFDELWEKKVNDGCDKQGILRIYPKALSTPPTEQPTPRV